MIFRSLNKDTCTINNAGNNIVVILYGQEALSFLLILSIIHVSNNS